MFIYDGFIYFMKVIFFMDREINLTIIVPMFNVERYIEKCIMSIFEQEWGDIKFEVLVIDDESPDNSLKIVEKLKNDYDNIKTISQKNKGLGGARNTGIKNAKGNFIFFLDSDDFLIYDNLPKLIQVATRSNLDILEFNAIRVDQNYNQIDVSFDITDTDICAAEEYIEKVNFAYSACNKIYRTQFIRDENIWFFERTYIEDAPFNFEAIQKAKRLQALNIIPVAYLQNPDSITRAKRDKQTTLKFISDSIKVTTRMNLFATIFSEKKEQNRLTSRVAFFVAGIIFYILKSDITISEKKKFINVLSQENLYPCPFRSDSCPRNLFLKFINQEIILSVLIKIHKLRRILCNND